MFNAIANAPCNNKVFSGASILVMASAYDRMFLAAQLLHPQEKIDGPSALARFLGESPQTITNWRRRGIPQGQITALARKLGCRADYIELGSGTMTEGPASAQRFDAPVAPPAAVVTYDKVRSAVSAVLDALGLQYEDLVPDQAAARRRIEQALRHEQADDDHIEQIGILMGRPGERYGPSRATYAQDKTRFQAEVSPESERNKNEEATPKQERRA